MLFNGEQIMTAGEIRRPAIGPISDSASQSMHGVWAALGEASADIARSERDEEGHEHHEHHEHQAIAAVAAVLAEDRDMSPRTRAAVETLLRHHRLLAEDLARQRQLLQEWILSQLTYKSLYYQYSGQKPEAPNVELMREKDMVRRRIREQLHVGCEDVGVLDEPLRSLSRP